MEQNVKSLNQLFREAKEKIRFVVNDKTAHNFKYAELDQVLEEVKKACKGLINFSTSHFETELLSYIKKTKNGEKLYWLSKGYKIIYITCDHSLEVLEFRGPANFSADEPEDATYGASTSGERYILNRTFGIPTLDELKAREKIMKEKQEIKNKTKEISEKTNEVLDKIKYLRNNNEIDLYNTAKIILGIDKVDKLTQIVMVNAIEKATPEQIEEILNLNKEEQKETKQEQIEIMETIGD